MRTNQRNINKMNSIRVFRLLNMCKIHVFRLLIMCQIHVFRLLTFISKSYTLSCLHVSFATTKLSYRLFFLTSITQPLYKIIMIQMNKHTCHSSLIFIIVAFFSNNLRIDKKSLKQLNIPLYFSNFIKYKDTCFINHSEYGNNYSFGMKLVFYNNKSFINNLFLENLKHLCHVPCII